MGILVIALPTEEEKTVAKIERRLKVRIDGVERIVSSQDVIADSFMYGSVAFPTRDAAIEAREAYAQLLKVFDDALTHRGVPLGPRGEHMREFAGLIQRGGLRTPLVEALLRYHDAMAGGSIP